MAVEVAAEVYECDVALAGFSADFCLGWVFQIYPSSQNDGSGKWIPPILVSFHLGWFSTSMVWLGFSDPWESKGRLPPQCQPCREIAGLMKRLLTIIVPQLMVNLWLIVVNRVSYGGLIEFSDPWESKDATPTKIPWEWYREYTSMKKVDLRGFGEMYQSHWSYGFSTYGFIRGY